MKKLVRISVVILPLVVVAQVALAANPHAQQPPQPIPPIIQPYPGPPGPHPASRPDSGSVLPPARTNG